MQDDCRSENVAIRSSGMFCAICICLHGAGRDDAIVFIHVMVPIFLLISRSPFSADMNFRAFEIFPNPSC